MTRRASVIIAVAAILSLAIPIVAHAQSEPPPAGRAGRPNRAVPNNADLTTILDAYAIVQAQNALQLNDEQYGRFVARLNRLQDTRRRNLQARNRMMQELRKLANDPATDETIIRDRLKTLRDHEDQAAEALRGEYDALYEVLDPRQQVRFRVFENGLEQRKLDLLIRARERARPAVPRQNEGSK
jgi:hypothetical protein